MRLEVVVLLFYVGGYLVRGVWSESFKSSDRPVLPQLQQFITKDGSSINLLQIIGVQYENFGTCLLADNLGVKMAAIKSDERSVDSKMREIITKWLQGGGKRPENWATIVSCLKPYDLNFAADRIEEQYTDRGTTVDTGTATRKSSSFQTQPGSDDDEIKNTVELLQAVENIGDWRVLCTFLGVDQGTMDDIKHSSYVHKKLDCLQAYIDQGKAKWSGVIKAVVMMKNHLVAKNIAKAHGLINYYEKVVKSEL